MTTSKITKRYAYVLVEVGKREFESRLIVKRQLEERGFIVFIGLKNIIIDLLVLSVLPQGIIFDKCAQLADNWRIKYLKKRGFKYACLDEEGIFTKLPEVVSRNNNLTNVDHLFANNKKHLNLIFKANPVGLNKNKISISGNPRQSNKLYTEYKTSFSYKPNDVLIIGNFSQYRIGAENREWDRSLLGKFDEEAIDIVKKLKNDKDFNIYYRPHPSETLWYEEYFSEQQVLKDNNILSLISKFKKIVCFRCTTSIEGRFFDAEVHNYSNSSRVAPILTRIGCVFKNYDELKANLLSNSYRVHNPRREKKVLDFLIPHKNPEVLIGEVLDGFSVQNNNKIHGKMCFLFSHILWMLYQIRYRKTVKVMYDKFNTKEIKDRLNLNHLKVVGKFIYE